MMMATTDECACRHHDAMDCARRRYGDTDEACECCCHDATAAGEAAAECLCEVCPGCRQQFEPGDITGMMLCPARAVEPRRRWHLRCHQDEYYRHMERAAAIRYYADNVGMVFGATVMTGYTILLWMFP